MQQLVQKESHDAVPTNLPKRILVGPITQLNEWKHFCWQFLLSLQHLCLIFFLLCLHFCILSHFEIIRYIVKSLIATSTYFLLKYNLKKKTWKLFFGRQSLDTQTSIPVSQRIFQYVNDNLQKLFLKCSSFFLIELSSLKENKNCPAKEIV